MPTTFFFCFSQNSYGMAVEAIIPLNKAKPRLLGGSITVNALITINGPVADQGNFAAILSEHSREIAEEVRRIFEIQAEQQAVV